MDTRARIILMLVCASIATVGAVVWCNRAGIKATLHREFPNRIKHPQQMYVRGVVFAFGAFAVLLPTRFGLSERTLGLEALWFQFGGAALLCWESNSRETFKVVLKELQTAGMRPPRTLGERIIETGLVGVVWVLAFVAVGLEVWLKAAPLGWRYVVISEAKAAALLSALFAISLASGGFVDWRAKRLARRIAGAGTPADAEWHGRRAVRFIGFSLVAIGTVLQVPSVLWG